MKKEKDMPLKQVEKKIKAEMEQRGVVFAHNQPVNVTYFCVNAIKFGGKSLCYFTTKNPLRYLAVWLVQWK